MSKENQIEENLIEQLKGLKYIHRPDIVDRKTLEQNFKAKFEELNRVHLTNNEFLRLREEIINSDVFVASKKLRERQYFQREDGRLIERSEHIDLIDANKKRLNQQLNLYRKRQAIVEHPCGSSSANGTSTTL